MKTNLFVSAMLSFLFAFFLVSCQNNRNDDNKGDQSTQTPGITQDTSMYDNDSANDFWDESKDYSYADRNELKSDFQHARNKLDQKINELQQEADNAIGDAKEELNNQVDKLEDKRHDLDSKWRDFGNVTEDNWDQFKSDINHSWNDVETTWQDIDSGNRENM